MLSPTPPGPPRRDIERREAAGPPRVATGPKEELPRRTFFTHGEPVAADALRLRIAERLGWECRIPDYRETAVLTGAPTRIPATAAADDGIPERLTR